MPLIILEVLKKSLQDVAIVMNILKPQVVVEGNVCARTTLFNRPSSLNAINKDKAVRLQKLYKDWEDDHDIGFVVLKERGRAFCAGGDLISLYNLMKQDIISMGDGKQELEELLGTKISICAFMEHGKYCRERAKVVKELEQESYFIGLNNTLNTFMYYTLAILLCICW